MTIETITGFAASAGSAPPGVAAAYIGPGAGLASIGALVAVGSGALIMFAGLVWYPVKQMRRKWRARRARKDPDDDPPPPPPTG